MEFLVKNLIFLCLFSLCGFFPELSKADLKHSTTCIKNAFSDPRIEYCITRTAHSKSKDVLFFLHGIFGTAQSWEGDGSGIREEWERQKIDPPTVVTISAGRAWLLNQKNILLMSGLLPLFIEEVFPRIEKHLQDLGLSAAMNGKRFLYGVSMGGFNAIQLYTNRPGWFDKIALVSPAIPTVSPFADLEDISQYVERTNSNWQDVFVALTLAVMHFPDETTWDEAAPLALAKKVGPHFPPIYMGVTTRDAYGFQEGDLVYADLAKKRGARVKKSYYEGNHALVKPQEIVDFFYSRKK